MFNNNKKNTVMIYIHKYLGLAGIDEKESTIANGVNKVFTYLTMLIIYIIAWQWEMFRTETLDNRLDIYLNVIVWGFFIVQAITSVSLVKDKKKYLSSNWMLFIIIIGGSALLWDYGPLVEILQTLRPLLILYLLIPWLGSAYRSLSDNRLFTTLITAILIMFLAGIFIAGLDPAIKSPWDGLWWAWVTMSTVGYGDVVPVSGVGRFFAAFLILMGLGLFSIITANFSAIFIQREVKQEMEEVKQENVEIKLILKNIQAVRQEEETIERMLLDLRNRLDHLEDKLDKSDK